MSYRLFLLILPFVLLLGCTENSSNRKLAEISDVVSDSPHRALTMLDSIDYSTLSKKDRHYYDFLSIKAKDKAYIIHTSDSLILDMLSYYQGAALYPEILYYAGRVYSDLGDYPTALEYFQKALDKSAEDSSEAIHLKGNILSQIGRMLNKVRLYDQAIPYLIEALRIDSIETNIFNLTYDNLLLGSIYLHQEDIVNADNRFRLASVWAQSLSESDRAHIQMYRAATKLAAQDIYSAVILIQGTTDIVRPIQKNLAYAYASDIYLSAGMTDSAYYYADKLIHSRDDNNRQSGYRNLLSPNLYDLIPKDSLSVYIRNYATTLETYYNKHEAQQVMIQNAFYNYSAHQKERIKAETRAHHLTLIIGILLFAILICIVIALIIRNRKKNLLLTLQSTILELDSLRKSIAQGAGNASTPINSNDIKRPLSESDVLRSKLQQQFHTLKMEVDGKTPIHPNTLKSEIYAKINEYINEQKVIPDKSRIWDEIEQLVISNSPNFKERLRLLVGEELKPHDYHAVLLIRCGITPVQLGILLGRTKGTISYRRKHICQMVLGPGYDVQFMDSLIRCI